MPRTFFDSFSEELTKLALDERKIYSPAIVAHEGGHARVHAKTLRDMALQYGQIALALGEANLNSKLRSKAERAKVSLAAGLASDTMTLADEYTSTLLGMKKIVDQKKYSKGELAHEAVRLGGAGFGYGTAPLARLASRIGNRKRRERIEAGLSSGALAGALVATSHTGPKINAREAKALVEQVSPGTDVYASKKPMSGGSVYVNKSYTPIGRGYMRVLSMGMGLKSEDAKRISRKGGVIVAPVTPVANLGLSLAQDVVQRIAGPIPMPNLTLPGANIERVPAEDE